MMPMQPPGMPAQPGQLQPQQQPQPIIKGTVAPNTPSNSNNANTIGKVSIQGPMVQQLQKAGVPSNTMYSNPIDALNNGPPKQFGKPALERNKRGGGRGGMWAMMPNSNIGMSVGVPPK